MYHTSQSQLSNVFHHNQQNKQDTASSSNLFYSGFGRNSPPNLNSISQSDSFNKSVLPDQSSLFSLPPQQVSTPPPSNFGSLTLEQNSNPYRTSRGGKRRSYQTTNLLFGENTLKGSSDFFEPNLVASAALVTSNLLSDRNAQEPTHLNESHTFRSHSNFSDFSNNEVNSFNQEQYENKNKTFFDENISKCNEYMGKTKVTKVNPEQIKLKENEKNLGELIKCFENDSKGSVTLIKKPLTKEERKEVRDRARKARMRIKNQDDNSNNFEGLINEISSQGTSLCSDVSTDVYLQEGGLDSNSSNDFFESNQREQPEKGFSSPTLPDSSGLATSKPSYFNEPQSESSSENITILQDSSLWKTSLQHNYIKTQLEFINDQQESSQQFHGYVEQHNHSDSFYNNQPNVSIIPQSFDIDFFQNESKCNKPEPYDKYQVEHLRREESQIKTQPPFLFKPPDRDPTLSTIESKSSDQFKHSESNYHQNVPSSEFNSITQHSDNTSAHRGELDYSAPDHHKELTSEFNLLIQHSVSTIEHRRANDMDSYGTFEHTPVNDIQNYFAISSKEEEAYSLNNPLLSDDDNKTTTSGNHSCYDELPQLSSDSASRISPYQLIDASKYPAPSSLNSNNSSPLEMVQNVSIGSSLYEKINGASSGSININSFDMGDLTSDTGIPSNSSIVSPHQLSESHVEKLNFLEDENTINKQHFLKKKVSEILHNAEHAGQYSISSVTAKNSSSYLDAANSKTSSSNINVFPRQPVDQNSVSSNKKFDVLKQNSSYEPKLQNMGSSEFSTSFAEDVNQSASFASNMFGSSNLNNTDLNLSRGSTGESKEYEYSSLEKLEKVSANTIIKDVHNSTLLNENFNTTSQKASKSENSFLVSLHKNDFATEQGELEKPSSNCNLAYQNTFYNGYEAKEGLLQYQELAKSITYQTASLLPIQNSPEVAQSQQKQIHESNQAEHDQTEESSVSSYHETPSTISQLIVQEFPKSQVLNTEAAKKKLSYPNPITQQTSDFDMPLQSSFISSQQEQQSCISVHDKLSSLQNYKDIFYSPLSHLNSQPPTQEYVLKNSTSMPVQHSTLKEASQSVNQNKSFPVNQTDNTILVNQPADLIKNQIKSSNHISSQSAITQPIYIAQDQNNSSAQGITQNQLIQQNIVGNQTFASYQSNSTPERSKQLSNLSSAEAVNQPNNFNQLERPLNNQNNDTHFNLSQNQAYPFSQNSTQGPVYYANSNFNNYSTGMPLINQAPAIPPIIDRTNGTANQQIPAPNAGYSTQFNQYPVQQPMVYENYPPFSQYSHYGGLYPNAWPHNTLEQIHMQQQYEQQYLDYYQQQAAYYNYYNQQLTTQFPPYPHYDYSQGYNWPGYYDQYSYGTSAASSVYESRPTSVIERRSSRNSDQALDELPDFSSDVSFQQQEVKEPDIKLIRSTPLSFTAVHLRVRFTPNDGKLCIVAPKQPLDGEVACIQNYAIESIIPIPLHKRFPGPLLRGDTNKKYILRLVQSTIQEILPSVYQNTNELVAQVALWEFVGLLVKQNGTFDGSDIADMLCALLPNIEVDGVRSRSLSMLSHSPKVVSDKTLEEYHHYMGTGQIRDGLEHSIKYEMWGHAFMLATSLGGRYLHHVQSRFMDSLKQSDPLKTLYSYLSGRDVDYFKKQAAAGTWIQNLCILASNTSGNKQKDRDRLIAFGDGLRDLQMVGAAHLCYLLAKVPFGLHTSKDAKIVLIGLEHRLDTTKAASVWAQPLNIQLTEIYQFAITLNDLSFTIPAFQNYKYEYALQLMEYGFSTEALAYFEAISEVILKEPSSEFFTGHLISGLIKYAELASLKDIKYYEEREVPDWLNQLHALSFKSSRHSSTSGNNIHSSNEYKKSTSEATGRSFTTQHSYSDSVNSNIHYHSDDTQEEKLKTYESTVSEAVQFDINNSNNFNANGCNKNSDFVPNPVENISDLNIEEKINYEHQETWHNQSPYQAIQKESVYSEEGFNEGVSSSQEGYFSEQSISNNDAYQYGYPENDPENTMWHNGSNENQPRYNQDYNYQDFSLSGHSSGEDIQASSSYKTQSHIPENEPELEPEEDLFREFSKKKNNDGVNDNFKKAKDELPRKTQKTAQPVNNKKGWLGSIISKFTPAKEVHLPDDKDNSIYYDEKLKRWVDKNEDPAEARKTVPPPPTAFSAPSTVLITPVTTSTLSSDSKILPLNNLPSVAPSSTVKRRSITKLQYENQTSSDKSSSVKESSLSNDSDKKTGPPSRFSMRAQGGSTKRGLRYVNAMGTSTSTTAPMAPVLDPFKIPGSNISNQSASQPIKMYFDPSQTVSDD